MWPPYVNFVCVQMLIQTLINNSKQHDTNTYNSAYIWSAYKRVYWSYRSPGAPLSSPYNVGLLQSILVSYNLKPILVSYNVSILQPTVYASIVQCQYSTMTYLVDYNVNVYIHILCIERYMCVCVYIYIYVYMFIITIIIIIIIYCYYHH